MLPDRVSNPGPLTYESGALPISLRGLAPQSDLFSKILTMKVGNLSVKKTKVSFSTE